MCVCIAIYTYTSIYVSFEAFNICLKLFVLVLLSVSLIKYIYVKIILPVTCLSTCTFYPTFYVF